MLDTFEEGSGYDQALIQVYGFDTQRLDEQWREYVVGQYATVS